MAKKKSKQIILSGGKMKFNIQPHPMHGGAWYNDLWDGVKSGFNYIAPKIADVAIPLATKALLGAGKRRKMKGRGTVIKA